MSAPETQPFNLREYVCVGRRLADASDLSNSELFVQFYELHEGAWTDKRHFYSLKPFRHCFPGNVYKVEANDEQVRPSTIRYARHWEDSSEVAEWQAATTLAEAISEERKENKRSGSNDELLRALEPYRKMYQNLIASSRRTALELIVLKALRTPLKK